jgi:hypothetical protein
MKQLVDIKFVVYSSIVSKAVTILIRIDRIADPDRIEIGSILRKFLPDPTILAYLNKNFFYYNKIYLNKTSIY